MKCLLLPVLLALTGCGGAVAGDDAAKPAPTTTPTTKPPSYVPAPGAGSGDATPSMAPCPASAEAPTSCGVYADACAGAEAIAVGTFAKIGALAVSEIGVVHFRADYTDMTPACGASLYTVTPAGNALMEENTGSVGQIGGAGGFVYWFEDAGPDPVLHARGVEFDLLPAGLAQPSTLITTPSGVLVVDTAAVYQLTGVTLQPLGARPSTSGAVPTFDGTHVFTSSTGGSLVRLAGDGVATLASDAAANEQQRTIAAADGTVYYVTSSMGISAVPSIGGMPSTLVPPIDDFIDTIVVDAQNVYFTVRNDIRRVPRTGGPVTVVKTLGAQPLDLFVDDTSLYFRLDVDSHIGEITAPGGVIARIPK